MVFIKRLKSLKIKIISSKSSTANNYFSLILKIAKAILCKILYPSKKNISNILTTTLNGKVVANIVKYQLVANKIKSHICFYFKIIKLREKTTKWASNFGKNYFIKISKT